MRDLLVVLAYSVTLAAACRLANVLVRRRVTREMGERLLAAVVVLGLVHVVENYVLAEVLRNPSAATDVVVGGLTAVAVTRCLILGIAVAFAIAGLGAGLAVLFRSLLGKPLLPEFDRPLLSVTDPTPEMATLTGRASGYVPSAEACSAWLPAHVPRVGSTGQACLG